MIYREIRIETESNRFEEVLAKLTTLGIDGVVIEDPEEIQNIIDSLDETEWLDISEIRDNIANENNHCLGAVVIYLEEGPEAESKEEQIRNTFGEEWNSFIKTKIRDDSEWKDNWKEYFKPVKLTERIIIAPSWSEEAEVSQLIEEGGDSPIIIRINPGVAFGTGTHESTYLTIRMMEKYMDTFSNPKVLDVGTGTGILAIIASYLGAGEVLGIDIDQDAVDVAKENIELNLPAPARGKVSAIYGDLTKGVDFEADVVLANLLADLIIRFAPDAASHLKEGGIFISSGIIREKKELVCEAIKKSSFHIEEIVEEGDWCAIVAIKA